MKDSKFEDVYFYEWKKRFLLGLVEIHYYCEDRRPGKTPEQCQTAPGGYKYKHVHSVRVAWKKVSWITRSLTKGVYFNPMEEKEVHGNNHPVKVKIR